MILGYLEVERYLVAVDGVVTGVSLQMQRTDNIAKLTAIQQKASDCLFKKPMGMEMWFLFLSESLLMSLWLPFSDYIAVMVPREVIILPRSAVSFQLFRSHKKRSIWFVLRSINFVDYFQVRYVSLFPLVKTVPCSWRGLGRKRLHEYHRIFTGSVPQPLALERVRPSLNIADRTYLTEVRQGVTSTNEENLAFYYQHKVAMEAILTAEKVNDPGLSESIRPPISRLPHRCDALSRVLACREVQAVLMRFILED